MMKSSALFLLINIYLAAIPVLGQSPNTNTASSESCTIKVDDTHNWTDTAKKHCSSVCHLVSQSETTAYLLNNLFLSPFAVDDGYSFHSQRIPVLKAIREGDWNQATDELHKISAYGGLMICLVIPTLVAVGVLTWTMVCIWRPNSLCCFN